MIGQQIIPVSELVFVTSDQILEAFRRWEIASRTRPGVSVEESAAMSADETAAGATEAFLHFLEEAQTNEPA